LRLYSLEDMLVLFKGIPIALLENTHKVNGDRFYGIPDSTISILRDISGSLNRIAGEKPEKAPIRYHIQRLGWNYYIEPIFLQACGIGYYESVSLVHKLDRVGIETISDITRLVDVHTSIPTSDLERTCGMHIDDINRYRRIATTLNFYKTSRHLCDANLNYVELSQNRRMYRADTIKVSA